MLDRADIEALIEKLFRQTCNLSSPIAMMDTPAFKALLKIGQDALPYLLEGLTAKKGIGVAGLMLLEQMTKENPVPEKDRRNGAAEVKAWLDWGRSKGYLA